jgi:hypothetical protein
MCWPGHSAASRARSALHEIRQIDQHGFGLRLLTGILNQHCTRFARSINMDSGSGYLQVYLISIARDSPDLSTWIRAQVTYRYNQSALYVIHLIYQHGFGLRLLTGILNQHYTRFARSINMDLG